MSKSGLYWSIDSLGTIERDQERILLTEEVQMRPRPLPSRSYPWPMVTARPVNQFPKRPDEIYITGPNLGIAKQALSRYDIFFDISASSFAPEVISSRKFGHQRCFSGTWHLYRYYRAGVSAPHDTVLDYCCLVHSCVSR